MQHLDERTLTLYVLRAEAVQPRREEISAHLEGCYGCRTLEAEIRQFYEDAEQHVTQLQKEGRTSAIVPAGQRAQVLRRRPVVYTGRYGPVPSPLERFRGAVRRHPVAAGSVGLGVLAALAALLMFAPSAFRPSHGEPAYYRLDATSGSLQILDRENRLVWQRPVNGLDKISRLESEYGIHYTQIADFRGEGKTQVLTALPLPPEDNIRNMALRLFDSDQHLLWARTFGHELHFGTRVYNANYTVYGVVPWKKASDAAPEICVTAVDERSPCVVARLDKDGTTLGEYWHFGHLASLYALPIGKDQTASLMLCGTNDAADERHGEYPVVVILDPGKITGQMASPMTPGFQMRASDAEQYYLKMPFPVLRDPGMERPFARLMLLTQDSLMTVEVKSGREDEYPKVFFTFDRELRLQTVWLDNHSISFFRDELLARGLEPDLGKYIITPLKQAVRYWDGAHWVAQPVRLH